MWNCNITQWSNLHQIIIYESIAPADQRKIGTLHKFLKEKLYLLVLKEISIYWNRMTGTRLHPLWLQCTSCYMALLCVYRERTDSSHCILRRWLTPKTMHALTLWLAMDTKYLPSGAWAVEKNVFRYRRLKHIVQTVQAYCSDVTSRIFEKIHAEAPVNMVDLTSWYRIQHSNMR